MINESEENQEIAEEEFTGIFLIPLRDELDTSHKDHYVGYNRSYVL